MQDDNKPVYVSRASTNLTMSVLEIIISIVSFVISFYCVSLLLQQGFNPILLIPLFGFIVVGFLTAIDALKSWRRSATLYNDSIEVKELWGRTIIYWDEIKFIDSLSMDGTQFATSFRWFIIDLSRTGRSYYFREKKGSILISTKSGWSYLWASKDKYKFLEKIVEIWGKDIIKGHQAAGCRAPADGIDPH